MVPERLHRGFFNFLDHQRGHNQFSSRKQPSKNVADNNLKRKAGPAPGLEMGLADMASGVPDYVNLPILDQMTSTIGKKKMPLT